MPSLDLSNSIEQIQSQIEAVKTYTEVSKSEKSLLKKHGAVTYPLLEIDNDTVLTDSHAMCAYLAKSTKNEHLLGTNDFDRG